jgi:hypothetical protein
MGSSSNYQIFSEYQNVYITFSVVKNVFFFETGSHCVAQVGLKLLGSDPPASTLP